MLLRSIMKLKHSREILKAKKLVIYVQRYKKYTTFV